MSLIDQPDKANEFGDCPVPKESRKGFGSIFSVWVNFQLSTVMLFFGGITLAHLPLTSAILVATVATVLIATVSSVTGYLGAKTGLSTALLCERIFGIKGGIIQQVFQGIIELGWFVVIVGLTGDAAATLLKITDPFFHSAVTMGVGALYVLSICYGFEGLKILSVVATPIVLVLLTILSVTHLSHSVGPLWHPIGNGPNLFQSISIATGTFITGAALSADIARFAKNGKVGATSGAFGFLVTIPLQLLLGAMVAMTSSGSPDFLRAVSESNLGPVVLIFLICANCIGDATLYLAVVPLSKLSGRSPISLVLTLGIVGSFLAALGVSQYIIWWLGLLGILLPPLAGPLIWAVINIWRGKSLPVVSPGIRRAMIAWLIGAFAGGFAELLKFGLAPVIGIVVSFTICALIDSYDN